MRRIVITGMGIICPLGRGLEPVWRRLVNGQSGIGAITSFNTELPCRIAGQVPPGLWDSATSTDRTRRIGILARLAAQEALDDAGWHPAQDAASEASGVSIGSGCGGLEALHEGALRLGSPSSPFLPSGMIHQLATDLAA